MEFLLTLLAVGFVWWGFAAILKRGKERQIEQQLLNDQKRASAHAEAACRFIDQVSKARCFPDISPGNVNMLAGEFAILRESATLFEQKTRRVSSAVGTRVKVGKIPLYLGSSSSSSYETTEPVADGELVLTNIRTIFLAQQRSATIVLKNVVGLEATLECIIIHSAKRKTPHVFSVGNPALWALLTKIGASHPFESRFIPEGVTVKATTTETPGDVNFETTLSQHPMKLQ